MRLPNDPFIIAEIGSNWRTVQDCLTSISIAASCGADAVKFQAFTYKDLYGIDGPGEWNLELPLSWLPALKEKADACGIEFMCTAFSPKTLRVVDKYVNFHKISSAENNYPKLLLAAKESKKPVFISTGATTLPDLAISLDLLNRDRTVLMYCCAEYPSKYHDLRNIESLRDKFGLPVGYSDHSLDVINAPLMAVKLGATVLEKHFNPCDIEGPDSPHSLNTAEFKDMVSYLREGKEPYTVSPGERMMVMKHNRRLVVTKDVKEGDILEYDRNFGVHRSLCLDAIGARPIDVKHFEGKPINTDLLKGMGLGYGHVNGSGKNTNE